ncbi:MAG: hypothetical protein LBJ59_03010 [Zoogloeaceae bacterium]|jgi:uncharacterized protein|nr:hypothetical protein [Zoogloeaceae bacterium]
MKRNFVVAVLIFRAMPVHAASFDCSKAKSEFEQAVCGDPKLSALDEELAKTCHAARAGMGNDARLSAAAPAVAFILYPAKNLTKGKA